MLSSPISLNSLHSLYSLLPGIVFDTRGYGGDLFLGERCFPFGVGIVFDTRGYEGGQGLLKLVNGS